MASRKANATALIILDMVNLFDFEGGDALGARAVAICAPIARLRQRFDAAAQPVIHVNDNFARWQGQFSDLVDACLAAGGDAAATVRRLSPRRHDYHVLKPKHSAFHATPLAILLYKLGVRRLVLTGVAADSCILATAQDAKMHEFGLWVPADCVAAISPRRKRDALAVVAQSLLVPVVRSRDVRGVFPAQP
ncbi:MAG: cysteine hydrolase [Stenotrophomonas sp.]|uniref:isochorismatase family cysteine hydrolase n=1 Tax=Stenotrophomonas sp. TaxID=69392 RepID=UPI001354E04A|nr:isochorismatase family cysteine hydrolase [Stenotrophomonas sp.]MTI72745.1 cysteine hydrolase [Stenotrophomonas sp.]